MNLGSTSYNFSRITALSVAIIGGSVILGWALNITVLKSIMPEFVPMRPNAALAFVLSGIALFLLQKTPSNMLCNTGSKICSFLVSLIGFFTLLEYIAGIDFGINEIFFKDSVAHGRMASVLAFDFFLIGIELMLLKRVTPFAIIFSQIITVVTFSTAFTSFLGYIYGIERLLDFTTQSKIALHATLTVMLLSAGIIFARPQHGIAAILISDSYGGMFARRAIPFSLAMPPLIGLFILAGSRAGTYSAEIGIALLILMSVALSSFFIFFHAVLWKHIKTPKDYDIPIRQAYPAVVASYMEQFFNKTHLKNRFHCETTDFRAKAAKPDEA